jgi:PIN domain nuclease of toxin-antitoxin system
MGCGAGRTLGTQLLILLDTHVLVWLIQGDAKLGRQAYAILDEAVADQQLTICAITPWEVSMLADKGRLKLGMPTARWVAEALSIPGLTLLPLEPLVAVAAAELPGDLHGDPADRLIIATARHLSCPIATADRAILGYAKTGQVTAIDARK